jgi:hypothetical protein
LYPEGSTGCGYALSGPKYYDAFRDVALKMVKQYGVSQFRFDGTGNVNSVIKGSRFDSDFDAMIHLIAEIRAVKPDIFINLSTGTWPSPFWLMRSDTVWRGGEDDSLAGVGSERSAGLLTAMRIRTRAWCRMGRCIR